MEIVLTGEYLDVTVAGVEDSCPFTCVFWDLGVVGGVDAGGIVGDGHFGWETCRGARGVVDGGGNMGCCESLIWVVEAVVVSDVGWLSNSTPLTNGGVGCWLGGVIDIGSLEEIVTCAFGVGSEKTLPGNSSGIISIIIY